jgi:hypothetical protein
VANIPSKVKIKVKVNVEINMNANMNAKMNTRMKMVKWHERITSMSLALSLLCLVLLNSDMALAVTAATSAVTVAVPIDIATSPATERRAVIPPPMPEQLLSHPASSMSPTTTTAPTLAPARAITPASTSSTVPNTGNISNSDSFSDKGDNDIASVIGNFNADSADCKQEEHGGSVCSYQGHASFTDKNARLWAPTIEVYRDSSNKIMRTVAIAKDGELAHYHYQGDASASITDNAAAPAAPVVDVITSNGSAAPGVKNRSGNAIHHVAGNSKDSSITATTRNETVDAHAETITIYPDRHLVVLQGSAFVARPHETITGVYIEYDTASKVMVSKPRHSSGGEGEGLTTIVLQPAKQSSEATPTPSVAAPVSTSVAIPAPASPATSSSPSSSSLQQLTTP